MSLSHALETLVQDTRYALRTIGRAPGFTAIAVLSLGLGIGANTAIFSLLDTVMLRRLPVPHAEELVELLSRYPGEPRMNGFWWKFYEHYRDHNHVFAGLIGMSPAKFAAAVNGREAETVDGAYVVGDFFPLLGVQPAIGRLIAPQDDRLGSPDAAVAVVSWRFWNTRFNRDPGILGSRIAVDGVPATVVGVAPRQFLGVQAGARPDVWLPAAMEPLVQRPSRRATGQMGLALIARLKPGVSIEQAGAEMRVLDRARVEEIAAASRDPLWRQATIEVAPAGAGLSGLRDRYGAPLLVLMAIVAVLLLIACTNVASMLLARAAARQQEMAVRVSLGASRSRIVRQMLTESLLLSISGGLLGMVVAYFGAATLVRILLSGRSLPGPRLEIHVGPDLRVLLFTAAVALLTGVLFGLAPAWNAFTAAPATSLRETGAPETRSRRRFGHGLVVAQVALSVVLLTAASVFVGHLSNLRNLDLGFQRESVLLVTLNPQGSGYDRTQLTGRYRELLSRFTAIPGVRSATLSAVTPIEGGAASRFATVEGFQENPEDRRYLNLNWIAPNYFETLGTPLVAGRDFQFEDSSRARVAIVNQAVARHYFADRSPLGRHLTFERDRLPYEIVGVAADAKYADLHEPAPRTVYLNAFQEGRIASQFALRTTGAPESVAAPVRSAVLEVMKNVPVAKVTTLNDQVNGSLVTERLIALLSGFFGALGAALVAVGLYGLLAYTVARRTREIGIRMALGASEGNVMRLVLTSALGLVGGGVAAGVPMVIWIRRLTESVIAGTPVPIAFAVVFAAAVMMVVGLLAAYLPARRAARVRPIEALRH